MSQKVLVVTQGLLEGTFFCRWIVPVKLMSSGIDITLSHNIYDISKEQYDYVVLYRWFDRIVFQYFEKIKSLRPNVKWIYETDDLLLDIPAYNYASVLIDKQAIRMFMTEVDGYIFSTNLLRKYSLKHLPPQCKEKPYAIIENRLDKKLWGEPEFNERADELLRIGYQGTGNRFSGKNERDDFYCLKNILLKTYNKYRWIFFGGLPINVVQGKNFFIKNSIEYYNWVKTYDAFVNIMKHIRYHVGLSPLAVNDFNKSKSNIKRLDYYAAGSVGLYSDSPIYAGAPKDTLIKNSEFSWERMIKRLNDSEEYRKELWLQEDEYFKKNPDKIWLQDSIEERIMRLNNLFRSL